MTLEADQPFVTVIMPVYNEAGFIAQSLGAVLEQTYPPYRMEVLVVDGRSSDATTEIIRRLAEADQRICLLDNPQRDQASALNIGIEKAVGEIIVRVDGHGRIPPGYVAACVDALQRTGADNAGGQMRAIGQSPFTWAVAAATSSPFAVGGSRFHYSDKPGQTDTVYLGAFRRQVFERVGRFDPAAVPNEDYELNYRIRAAGGIVYYDPAIWAHYYVRPSLAALIRQYARYGWRKAFVIRQHPRSAKLRHLIAPAFTAALLVGGVAALVHPWGVYFLGGVVISYALANSLASLHCASKYGWRHLPWLPLIFGAIHLSWGSGFLAGALAQLFGRRA